MSGSYKTFFVASGSFHRLLNGKVLIAQKFHVYNRLAGKVSYALSDIGEGIKDVVVKEWFVKVGDKVSQFDEICEVQSDKASVTITSRYDGIVSKLYYKTDDTALVGKPLVDIETDDNDTVQDEPSKAPEETTEAATTSKVQETRDTTDNGTLCIPSVRRLAKEHNLNLTLVEGSGKNGRILKEDVLKYMDTLSTSKPTINVPETPKPTSTNTRVEPIKGFAKTMVKTMTESLKIPQLMFGDEINVTQLSQLRATLINLNQMKISFLPFFVKAFSNALQKYPIINASVDEKCENIIYHASHNIGIAMDTPFGLAVPVIKNVENLSVMDIAGELQRLIKCGKEGVFSPSDVSGCTFSISNVGSIAGTYMKPLILPPNVAIVALGSSKVLPRFDGAKNIIAEEIVNISGSADHRVLDGATMANFIKVVKKQIETPYLLFLNL